MFLGARTGEFEREFQDAIGADAAEDGLLGDELAIGANEHAAANGGVFTLGVFANDVEVDVGFGAVRQWRAHAGHEFAGAEVHVLVEAAANGDEQTQREM